MQTGVDIIKDILKFILYEDRDIIVLNKPAGLLAQKDGTEREALSQLVLRYLKEKINIEDEIFLGPIHRLDRPVSGVMLFAKNRVAAGRLSDDFRNRKVNKHYYAMVPSRHELNGYARDWIELNQYIVRRRGRAFITEPEHPKSANVILRYRVAFCNENYSLLTVLPVTGRRHQIRVQLSSSGLPVIGDWTYGSKEKLEGGIICLHSASLIFTHPMLGSSIEISAPLPEHFQERVPGIECYN